MELSTGWIVAIVLGIIIVILTIAIFFAFRKKKYELIENSGPEQKLEDGQYKFESSVENIDRLLKESEDKYIY